MKPFGPATTPDPDTYNWRCVCGSDSCRCRWMVRTKFGGNKTGGMALPRLDCPSELYHTFGNSCRQLQCRRPDRLIASSRPLARHGPGEPPRASYFNQEATLG